MGGGVGVTRTATVGNFTIEESIEKSGYITDLSFSDHGGYWERAFDGDYETFASVLPYGNHEQLNYHNDDYVLYMCKITSSSLYMGVKINALSIRTDECCVRLVVEAADKNGKSHTLFDNSDEIYENTVGGTYGDVTETFEIPKYSGEVSSVCITIQYWPTNKASGYIPTFKALRIGEISFEETEVGS